MNIIDSLIQTGKAMRGKAAPNIVPKTEANGIVVSTIDAWDKSFETAIIDKNGTYPVERYDDKQKARMGHIRWSELAPDLEEIEMIQFDESKTPEKIVLERMSEGELDSWRNR